MNNDKHYIGIKLVSVKKFFKEYKRMCAYHSNIECAGCPLSKVSSVDYKDCLDYCSEHPEEAVHAINEWVEGHPPKTYRSVFLEKFPNAETSAYDVPPICVSLIFGKGEMVDDCSAIDCAECWNRGVEG